MKKTASAAPVNCAKANSGASTGRMPAKVCVRVRANVTAGLANDVLAVTRYAAKTQVATSAGTAWARQRMPKAMVSSRPKVAPVVLRAAARSAAIGCTRPVIALPVLLKLPGTAGNVSAITLRAELAGIREQDVDGAQDVDAALDHEARSGYGWARGPASMLKPAIRARSADGLPSGPIPVTGYASGPRVDSDQSWQPQPEPQHSLYSASRLAGLADPEQPQSEPQHSPVVLASPLRQAAPPDDSAQPRSDPHSSVDEPEQPQSDPQQSSLDVDSAPQQTPRRVAVGSA